MTRRHLALLAGVLLFFGVAINAPAKVAEAARLATPTTVAGPHSPAMSLRVGDGIFRLRIMLCESCGTRLSVEINFAHFLVGARMSKSGPQAVNHPHSAA